MGQNREGRGNPSAITEGVGMTPQRSVVMVGLGVALCASGALAQILRR
jgi:hypothetical protein